MSSDVATQIRTALISQSLPHPSQAWLADLLASRPRPPPPLPSLIATARSRLLAADLLSPGLLDPSYVAAAAFPPWSAAAAADGSDGEIGPETREARLPRDVVVQVLDVENLSRSRGEQVDELEGEARGELKRGREIIRLPGAGADEDGDEEDDGEVPPEERAARATIRSSSSTSATAPAPPERGADRNATHRLVVQDCKGQKLYALELRRVERVGVGRTAIGEKLLLRRGTVVARGTVLLEPANVVVLGGKVEVWQKAWAEGRLARLKKAAGIGEGLRR